MTAKLIQYLSQFITEERFNRFLNTVENRTRYITIVLEDIYQSHNASAVLRTCDCFGIQDVHVIENKNKYIINPDVALGSSKWLNIIKYNKKENNTESTINKLRKNNYRIVATTPHSNSVLLENFDLKKGKIALLFGTELTGLSTVALKNADEYLKIPVYGFTESYNISVSAAIILYDLILRLKKSSINWKLNSDEKNEIILNWLRKSIKNSNKIIKEFNNNVNNINSIF
ncbi:MAG: RNA methyltransferase [Bacteroidales bacterium]|nr:RNA methyltransferase [Bacteroidales bacterium]